jgi:hypothetical protein
MSKYLPQNIVEKYKKTSNKNCFFPDYAFWKSLQIKERVELVKMECNALNEHPLIKEYDITATPYLADYRHSQYGSWAGDICVDIYFHGNPDIPYTMNTVTNIGYLPVCYGIYKDKTRVFEWIYQLEDLGIK